MGDVITTYYCLLSLIFTFSYCSKASASAAAMIASRSNLRVWEVLEGFDSSTFSLSVSDVSMSSSVCKPSSVTVVFSSKTSVWNGFSCFSVSTSYPTMKFMSWEVSGTLSTGSSSIFVRLALAVNTSSMNCGSRRKRWSVSLAASCWLSFFE